MRRIVRNTCLVFFNVAFASWCIADTYTVDDDGKADFNNIQDAIDVAENGDEILVMPGDYFGSGQNGSGDSVVRMNGKSVWLHSSNGPEQTVINGLGKMRGIMCVDGETSGTHIQGFRIENCYAMPYDWDGNGSQSYGTSGGGMANVGSSPRVSDCAFVNNVGEAGGGGMFNYNGSSPIIYNCSFVANGASSNGFGGGMSN